MSRPLGHSVDPNHVSVCRHMIAQPQECNRVCGATVTKREYDQRRPGRHGPGRSLLRRSFAELAGRGMREVRLGVDAQNVHAAVALYEGVGMSVHRRYDTFDLGTSEAAELTRGSENS